MSVSSDTEPQRSVPERDSEEFASQVRGMFDRIAGVYDLMNSAMTAGLHHEWRQRAVDRAEVGPSIMPSYAGLPPQKFQALTAYLASLN